MTTNHKSNSNFCIFSDRFWDAILGSATEVTHCTSTKGKCAEKCRYQIQNFYLILTRFWVSPVGLSLVTLGSQTPMADNQSRIQTQMKNVFSFLSNWSANLLAEPWKRCQTKMSQPMEIPLNQTTTGPAQYSATYGIVLVMGKTEARMTVQDTFHDDQLIRGRTHLWCRDPCTTHQRTRIIFGHNSIKKQEIWLQRTKVHRCLVKPEQWSVAIPFSKVAK